ncbi:PAAR domain-containing protein [Burkholderia stagnalis]|nr:DUF2345 domain-containing protein [Burkholderia stagnalis]
MKNEQGRDMVRLGDVTDHGGTVAEATDELKHLGIAVALDGHAVMCPKCDGMFPLLASGPRTHRGRRVGYLGDRTGYGAIAAAGKVRIEAQADGVDIKAKQSVSISSTTDSIHLHAAKEIVLHAGGTQVRIGDQGYSVHTAGEHTIHAGSHQTEGPQGQRGGFPPFPKSGPGQLEVLRRYVTDAPVEKSTFTVTDSLGATHGGTLDASGRAIVNGLAAGAVSVQYERDPHDPWVMASHLKPPRWQPDGTA